MTGSVEQFRSQHPAPNSGQVYVPEDDTISLLDLVLVVAKHARLIVLLTSLTAIGTVGYLLASKYLPPDRSPLPNTYTAEGTLLIDSGQSSPLSQLPSQLSGLVGNIDLGQGGPNNRELALRLLQSRSVLDAVARDLNLAARYSIEEPVQVQAREMLRGKMATEADSATGTIQIQFTDTDPQFAAVAVSSIMDNLRQRLGELGVDQNRRKLQLLDTKIAEVNQRIDDLEQRTEQFQRDHGIMSADSLAQERAQLMGELRSKLVLTQLELDYSSEFAMPGSPEIRRLQAQRDSYAQLLQQMQSGQNRPESLGPSQQDLPALMFAFERLQRELDVQTAIYRSLVQEREVTRLSVDSESPVFQVLEAPEVPQKRSGPSRSMISVIATITAFFLSVFLAFVLEYLDRARTDPEEGRKLASVKEHLKSTLRVRKAHE
tara:strand:- start:1323 stop:2618 length:1296 start_codon:yes stop_codon:yes gene_type:complete